MADDLFRINTGAITEMSIMIKKQAADYLQIIEETTAIVDELGAHWEGNSYQTFKEGYHARLASLQDLNNSLNSFSRELEDRADSARQTAQEIGSILGKY